MGSAVCLPFLMRALPATAEVPEGQEEEVLGINLRQIQEI